MNLRYRKFWLVIGYLLVAFVIQQTLTPSPVDVIRGLSDKILHIIGYFVLMGWFVQIYQQNKTRLMLAVCLVAMGIGLEYLQGLSGIRQYEVNDMLANSLGVIIAWVLGFTPFSKLLNHIDQFIQSKINSRFV